MYAFWKRAKSRVLGKILLDFSKLKCYSIRNNRATERILAMEKPSHADMDAFYAALLSLKTTQECREFFEDLCTIKELQALSQRFRVACLLDEGRNYLEVSEATGASSATISRVNRCLNYGTGYRRVLDARKGNANG